MYPLEAVFGPQEQNLNKLGRGPLDDATGSMTSGFGQKDFFLIISLYKPM